MSIKATQGAVTSPLAFAGEPISVEIKSWSVNGKLVTLYQDHDDALWAKVARETKEVIVSQADISFSEENFSLHHLRLRLIGSSCQLNKVGKNFEIIIKVSDAQSSIQKVTNVCFLESEWDDLKEVIKGLQEAKNGSYYAVVGEAGVGKSTFINTIRGISWSYKPEVGIVFDQEDALNKKLLLAQMSSQLGKGVTRYSTSYPIPGSTQSLLDTGGFFDPSMMQEMISTLSSIMFLREARRVKLMILISCDSLLSPAGRGRAFFDTATKIYFSFLDPSLIGSTLLIFTHPNRDGTVTRELLINTLKTLRKKQEDDLLANGGRDPLLCVSIERRHELLELILRPRKGKGLEDEGFFVRLFDPVRDLNRSSDSRSSKQILDMIQFIPQKGAKNACDAVDWITEPKKMFGVTLSSEVQDRFLLGLQNIVINGLMLLDHYDEYKRALEQIDKFGTVKSAKEEAEKQAAAILSLEKEIGYDKKRLRKAEKSLEEAALALEELHLFRNYSISMNRDRELEEESLKDKSMVARAMLTRLNRWAVKKVIKYPYYSRFERDLPPSAVVKFDPPKKENEREKSKEERKRDYSWRQELKVPSETRLGWNTYSIYFLTRSSSMSGKIEVKALGKDVDSVVAAYNQECRIHASLEALICQKEKSLILMKSLGDKTMTEIEYIKEKDEQKKKMDQVMKELTERKEFAIFCDLYRELGKEFETDGPLKSIADISAEFTSKYQTFVREELTKK